MEFRKTVMITLYAKQKKRHRCTDQLIFNKDVKAIQWMKRSLQRLELEQRNIHRQKTNVNPNLVSCIRSIPKWIVSIKVKCKHPKHSRKKKDMSTVLGIYD